MQAHHVSRHDGVTQNLEWMGLMVAVLALAGLTAGGIHSGTRQAANPQLVTAQH